MSRCTALAIGKNAQDLRRMFRANGIRGWGRPELSGFIEGPFYFTTTATGPDDICGTTSAALYQTDPNLAEFLNQAGKAIIIASSAKLAFIPRAALDAEAEQGAIGAMLATAALTHTPSGGQPWVTRFQDGGYVVTPPAAGVALTGSPTPATFVGAASPCYAAEPVVFPAPRMVDLEVDSWTIGGVDHTVADLAVVLVVEGVGFDKKRLPQVLSAFGEDADADPDDVLEGVLEERGFSRDDGRRFTEALGDLRAVGRANRAMLGKLDRLPPTLAVVADQIGVTDLAKKVEKLG